MQSLLLGGITFSATVPFHSKQPGINEAPGCGLPPPPSGHSLIFLGLKDRCEGQEGSSGVNQGGFYILLRPNFTHTNPDTHPPLLAVSNSSSPLLTFPNLSSSSSASTSSSSLCPPPPPLTLQSPIIWLPVGSRHVEMYERGGKRMANSIKSYYSCGRAALSASLQRAF